MKIVISQSTVFGIFFLISFLVFGCNNKPSSTGSLLGDDGLDTSGNPFGGNFQSDMAGGLNSGGSALTDTDKTALNNMAQGMESVNTNSPDAGLPQELIDEANRILDAEANTDGAGENNAQIQQAKMALVGKILESCAKKVAPFAPVPGQPLMGIWAGGGACPVSFTVSGPAQGQSGPVYAVNPGGAETATTGKNAKKAKSKTPAMGGTQGQMTASADGRGEVRATPFSGTLTDAPQAGSGKLLHPTFNKSKSGASPCEVAVQLQRSTNPIPENYVEAMRQVGKCHRQALLFMSPVMDKMLSSMPPQLKGALLNQAMGVGQ